MSEDKKKTKNLAIYAVCMILTVVILIIFAAMADNREEHFESRIHEQEELNVGIQNQIVALTDENYNLKKELESKNETLTQQSEEIQFLTQLSEAWILVSSNKKEDAANKLESLKAFDRNDERTKAITALENALQ